MALYDVNTNKEDRPAQGYITPLDTPHVTPLAGRPRRGAPSPSPSLQGKTWAQGSRSRFVLQKRHQQHFMLVCKHSFCKHRHLSLLVQQDIGQDSQKRKCCNAFLAQFSTIAKEFLISAVACGPVLTTARPST